MKAKILFFLINFSCCISAFTQPGTLDAEFGNGGIVNYSPGAINNNLYAMAIQPDGKIILAGEAFPKTVIVRLQSDGSPDNSFGTNGQVTSDFGFEINFIRDIVLQPDGKIIAIVRSNMNFSDNAELIIVRYNTDGTIDETFGQNGYVVADTGSATETGLAVAQQTDGKIIIAARLASPYGFILTRYHATGEIDATFGTNGLQFFSFATSGTTVSSMILQTDGKILVGGSLTSSGITFYAFAVARFNPDGTKDSGFGTDGVVITQVSQENNLIRDMALQPDGKILATGSADGEIPLIRYNSDGTLDESFGTGGIVLLSFPGFTADGASVLVQPDGKIVTAGTVSNTSGTSKDFTVLRYLPSGEPDLDFGVDGKVTTITSQSKESATDIALDNNGKIVVGGHVFLVEFVVAKYLSGLDTDTIDPPTSPNRVFLYPNPIAETATLQYSLTKTGNISIRMYDFEGRLVHLFLNNKKRDAGQNEEILTWPQSLPRANYLLVISSEHDLMTVQVFR